jgi:hypothetical protein
MSSESREIMDRVSIDLFISYGKSTGWRSSRMTLTIRPMFTYCEHIIGRWFNWFTSRASHRRNGSNQHWKSAAIPRKRASLSVRENGQLNSRGRPRQFKHYQRRFAIMWNLHYTGKYSSILLDAGSIRPIETDCDWVLASYFQWDSHQSLRSWQIILYIVSFNGSG